MDTEPHLWCWISGYLVALGSLAYSSFFHFDWVVFYLNLVVTYQRLLCLSKIAPLGLIEDYYVYTGIYSFMTLSIPIYHNFSTI